MIINFKTLVILVAAQAIVSTVMEHLPFDYSIFGGRFLATYLVLPTLWILKRTFKIGLDWSLSTPEERSDKLETAKAAYEQRAYPLRVVACGLPVAIVVYVAFVVALTPDAMPRGHGSLPETVAASLPSVPLIFPLPEVLPPPEHVEKELPPRKRKPEPRKVTEAKTEQIPVAEVVEWEAAPKEEKTAPGPPVAPMSLRIIAAPSTP